MNMPHHRLAGETFAALAGGNGGIDAVRELAAVEYSKHMTFLWGVVAAAKGTEQYPLARAGYDLLDAVRGENRQAAETVIRFPSVGAWARRTVQASRGGPAMPLAEPGMLRVVGAAAAIRAGRRAEFEVPVTQGRVMLPSLGAALLPGHTAVVRSGPGYAEIGQVQIPQNPFRDAPGWLGLRRVQAGPLDILIDDLDPFRMPEEPEVAPRLDTEALDGVLREAWRLLSDDHPGIATEIATAVRAIVPLSRPSQGEVSTSSPETFGAVGMSLQPDPVTCAATLAHEIQHLKLGALLDVVTLALPDDNRRYYAPWRDDPRPVSGLLQGAYAYLGVSGFWRRQRILPGSPLRAHVEYARWRAATALAVETLLSSGHLTGAGLEFVGEMARTLGPWQEEPVPIQARTLARRAAESHLARWQSVHGPIRSAGGRSQSRAAGLPWRPPRPGG